MTGIDLSAFCSVATFTALLYLSAIFAPIHALVLPLQSAYHSRIGEYKKLFHGFVAIVPNNFFYSTCARCHFDSVL